MKLPCFSCCVKKKESKIHTEWQSPDMNNTNNGFAAQKATISGPKPPFQPVHAPKDTVVGASEKMKGVQAGDGSVKVDFIIDKSDDLRCEEPNFHDGKRWVQGDLKTNMANPGGLSEPKGKHGIPDGNPGYPLLHLNPGQHHENKREVGEPSTQVQQEPVGKQGIPDGNPGYPFIHLNPGEHHETKKEIGEPSTKVQQEQINFKPDNPGIANPHKVEIQSIGVQSEVDKASNNINVDLSNKRRAVQGQGQESDVTKPGEKMKQLKGVRFRDANVTVDFLIVESEHKGGGKTDNKIPPSNRSNHGEPNQAMRKAEEMPGYVQQKQQEKMSNDPYNYGMRYDIRDYMGPTKFDHSASTRMDVNDTNKRDGKYPGSGANGNDRS